MNSDLRIDFVDVGLGDATLINCSDRKTQILIDGGDSNHHYPESSLKLLQHLNYRMPYDDLIEIFINTHPHRDHLLGFIELLESKDFRVSKTYAPNYDFEGLISRLNTAANYPHSSPVHEPLILEVCGDDKVELYLIPPDARTYQHLNCPEDINNCGLIVIIKTQDTNILILGDALSERQRLSRSSLLSLIQDNPIILRAAHHGSSYSIDPAFIRDIKAESVVISTGNSKLGRSSELLYPTASSINFYTSLFPEQKIRTSISAFKDAGQGAVLTKLTSSVYSTNVDGSLEVRKGKIKSLYSCGH